MRKPTVKGLAFPSIQARAVVIRISLAFPELEWISHCLMVWNMNLSCFHSVGNFIPTNSIIFRRLKKPPTSWISQHFLVTEINQPGLHVVCQHRGESLHGDAISGLDPMGQLHVFLHGRAHWGAVRLGYKVLQFGIPGIPGLNGLVGCFWVFFGIYSYSWLGLYVM